MTRPAPRPALGGPGSRNDADFIKPCNSRSLTGARIETMTPTFERTCAWVGRPLRGRPLPCRGEDHRTPAHLDPVLGAGGMQPLAALTARRPGLVLGVADAEAGAHVSCARRRSAWPAWGRTLPWSLPARSPHHLRRLVDAIQVRGGPNLSAASPMPAIPASRPAPPAGPPQAGFYRAVPEERAPRPAASLNSTPRRRRPRWGPRARPPNR